MAWKDKVKPGTTEFAKDPQKNPDGVGENQIAFFDFSKEIPEYRYYHVSHGVAGDTDSIYLKLPKTIADTLGSLDEIVGFCDDVGRETGAFFPEFVTKAFNCPEDRVHFVSTDREVVSDRAFFVTKKRYAMHIVDDEGKRVDKLKIMGLEVKKSDTSKAVKRFLRKIIDMVVDGTTERELMAYKNEFKKEFYQLPISEIGIPMPAKKLSQYEKEFAASGSMKGFPYHYRAAIYYNSMCGNLDRKIFPGEKFYVCNIKDKDSNYIGVPVTSNKVPEFVEDVVIDYDKMWKKADVKFVNYMESLEWDLQSKMNQQASDMFGVGA